MSHDVSSFWGAITAVTAWALNPVRDAARGDLVVNCDALLLQHDDVSILIYALQDPELYDPMALRCSVHIFVNDGDALAHSDELMRRWGMITHEWSWKEADFSASGGITFDASNLPFHSTFGHEEKAEEGVLYLYQQLDTLQILGTPADVDKFIIQ